MAFRDRLGDGIARAILALAKRTGISFSFSHRGAASVTLFAVLISDRIELADENMRVSERRIITLQVPVQAGFAFTSTEGEPVTPGDLVSFNGREHFIMDPVEKDVTGRIYVLRCVEKKRLKQG